MKRLSLAFLVVSGLMLAFTSMMSAYAEVQLPADIRFKGHAMGTCGLFYGYQSMPEVGPPYPLLWRGLAYGSIRLEGYAKATIYEWVDNPILWVEGGAYFAEAGNVKALGSVVVKWHAEDRLHRLLIFIYSNPDSGGVFWPEEDTFVTAQIPDAPVYAEPLSFMGIYQAGLKVQQISGQIVVVSMVGEYQYPGFPEEYLGLEIIMTYLYFGDYALQVVWASETFSIPWPPGETLTIPAATMLVRDVKLL